MNILMLDETMSLLPLRSITMIATHNIQINKGAFQLLYRRRYFFDVVITEKTTLALT